MKVINGLPKSCISDNNVRYNPEIEVYKTLMSDTHELAKIPERLWRIVPTDIELENMNLPPLILVIGSFR